MERVRLYKENEPLSVMKDIENKESGVDISEYAYEVVNTEEYYTSVNKLTFSYATDLPYAADLQRNNVIRAFTNNHYNLYIIQYVDYDTDDEIVRVECDHYTTVYAGEAVPDFTMFEKELTIGQVVQALNNSQHKSPDYNIRLANGSESNNKVNLETYNPGNQTIGQMWTGSGSFLRTHYGVLIIRDLQGITIVDPSKQNTANMPLTLGVNIKGLSYKLEEPERYTTAMVNLATIPDFEVQGTGLGDIKKVYSGIANTNLNSFNEISEGDELQVFYKGMLLRIYKDSGSLYVTPYSKPKLLHTIESIGVEPLFHQNLVSPFDGVRLKIVQGDKGNELTILDEDIDFNYMVGYRAYVNYKNLWSDPQAQVGTKKYFGFTPEPSNGVGDDLLDIIFSKIDNELYKVPVKNPYYEGRGNNTYIVDYPAPKTDLVRTKDNPRGMTEAYHFYRWFFQGYRRFWDSDEAKKLNKIRFNATVEIDAMTSLFGVEYIDNIQFMLGNKYKVRANKQGLDFESEITKITYDVSNNELISVEFGNYQDFEVEEYKGSSQNTEQARRIYQSQSKTGSGDTSTKRRTNTKPVIELRETKIIYQGPESSVVFADNLIRAYDKEDGDLTHKVFIEQTETDATYSVTDSDGNTTTKKASIDYGESGSGGFDEDEIGEWLDDALNRDDLRSDKELFDGDLPYTKRTDDTGIPRMEWEPPYVTISPDGSESTPTKLICYNGAESVIGEVKYKGEYGAVRMYGDGGFHSSNGKNFLPDNIGFPIVPYPEGTLSIRTWTPVFGLASHEAFNKDVEHGTLLYSESNVSLVDFNIAKESLGYRFNLAINTTTKGTVKFEVEQLHLQRQLSAISQSFYSSYKFYSKDSFQIGKMKDFKKHVIDILVGKTTAQTGYNGNYPNEEQTLLYYVMQVENGELPYIIKSYRMFLKGIADRLARVSESPLVIDNVLTIHFDVTDKWYVNTPGKIITSVDLDESKLDELSYNKLIKEEPGWQRLIFTQPTTKVNDQSVKVNQLLITNGGTSAQEALISKQSVDDLWELLTPNERKEFEDIYGKEWLFNLRYTPNYYDSDDVLFGAFYRENHKVKSPGDFDPFGIKEATERKYQRVAKKISERYQHKYNFLVANGYTVSPSHSGQVTYDRVEKYYLEQGAIEA